MCKFEPHYTSVLSMSQCFSDDKEMILYLNKARLAVDRDKPVNFKSLKTITKTIKGCVRL